MTEGETINLFDTGRHNAIIKRLSVEICTWQRQVSDKIKIG